MIISCMTGMKKMTVTDGMDFSHARAALKNAKKDFQLGEIEQDVIQKHMFPLNLKPPKYKESVLVCLADKLSALEETIRRR